jgi:anti-sigma B factor antagonist
VSVIGRIRSRRRSSRQPRLAADGRFAVAAGDTDGAATLAVSGEVDIATAPVLREALRAHAGRSPLLIDLSAVTFMDSSGLAVLLDLHQRAGERGERVAFIAPSQPVRLLFDVTGLGDELHLFSTAAEALAG